MMRSGSRSEPDGPRFGRLGKGRAGRKGKRKWTPEPGAHPHPTRRFGGPPPDGAGGRGPESHRQPAPPEPPPRYPPGVPTADEAPTGAAPIPPRQGARPYPPGSDQWRTQPVRREPAGEDRAGYERYDTGGYVNTDQRRLFEGTEADAESATRFESPPSPRGGVPKLPKKLTVTRVAALRGRQLTGQAVDAFHRATKADGADKSGLTSLTYATMLNYASDAAMAVALANTLFFAATSGESRGRVALYLLITIAPFALVAPVIGPALDRIQRGRRLAMCVASAGQALMCVFMALHFDDWGLYPAALGKMVLSRSFMVLKAAVTPRVVPPEITLSKTNARLTVFGLAAGGVFGVFASGFNWAFGSAGALWFAAAICVTGAVQAMRIPSWVEVTEGEVPASLSAHPERGMKRRRQPMGRHVVVGLWGNGTVRVLTGFLMMFAAFAVKAHTESAGQSPFVQLLMLGAIGGAAGAGGFLGNALGSRLHFGRPDQVILGCLAGALVATVVAAVLAGLATAALVGLVGATASALSKVSLDALIQQDLPEESRASAFGRSETVLQMSWCFGGAVGLLLPPTYWIGFLVVSVLLALGLAQTWLVRKGGSLIPGLGGDRPLRPGPVGAAAAEPAGSRFRARSYSAGRYQSDGK
ncbi:Predicted arabinose efflux permease, MFS family [Amycolatopsis arida]|uniref:Predicted arabinose efflux permease, MFS family n=1 Tax=Amycolatopsis arida TaxID=587909 RepID=A0A1I5QKQ0_9PSEU|nr:MFS transporter [Amycolatopsis arida]TDX98879.1 putative MFS family arabinose efflux permease [Amycolatopsis arida]SFP46795.1 Predicted arabinose efflux permease, MFS family [Amycolatopsis arida]